MQPLFFLWSIWVLLSSLRWLLIDYLISHLINTLGGGWPGFEDYLQIRAGSVCFWQGLFKALFSRPQKVRFLGIYNSNPFSCLSSELKMKEKKSYKPDPNHICMGFEIRLTVNFQIFGNKQFQIQFQVNVFNVIHKVQYCLSQFTHVHSHVAFTM